MNEKEITELKEKLNEFKVHEGITDKKEKYISYRRKDKKEFHITLQDEIITKHQFINKQKELDLKIQKHESNEQALKYCLEFLSK